ADRRDACLPNVDGKRHPTKSVCVPCGESPTRNCDNMDAAAVEHAEEIDGVPLGDDIARRMDRRRCDPSHRPEGCYVEVRALIPALAAHLGIDVIPAGGEGVKRSIDTPAFPGVSIHEELTGAKVIITCEDVLDKLR